jgi:ADP-ribosyl-[dinitrogen reductase] hydrolase
MNTATKDAALGALLGALAGDAAGGVLEFIGHKPTAEEVEQALRFAGGGCHRLAPGQITDDGELTLCLARGLLTAPREKLPQVESVAAEYFNWMQSSPFDLGNTTMASMGACHLVHANQHCCAQAMGDASAARCMASKANGSLMRCTPLAIWGYSLPTSTLAEWARADSRLSHPNSACTDSVAAYVIAIAHLLENAGDHVGAVKAATSWARENACEEVREWLMMAAQGKPAEFYPQAGFVKIAFTHAFYHLGRATSYSESITETLLGGGDTDTNACIVGGLMGALHGAAAIPAVWQKAVLECDTSLGRKRPAWLSGGTATTLVAALLA